MIKVGQIIGNREVLSVFENKYCLAKCTEYSPEPYVVWNVDADGEGVHTGRYYVERDDAQWCYAGLCFPWFQDNVHINMIEDEPAANVETQSKEILLSISNIIKVCSKMKL